MEGLLAKHDRRVILRLPCFQGCVEQQARREAGRCKPGDIKLIVFPLFCFVLFLLLLFFFFFFVRLHWSSIMTDER